MASLPESIPVDSDAGLRESYLYQLRPEERNVLVPLVATVLMLAREGHCVHESPFPPTFANVWGITKDLRFLESLLRHISSYQDSSSDHLWHARLLVLAHQIGPRVGELAAELENELMAVAGEARGE